MGGKASSLPSLWRLDLLGAGRQSDAYTCLRLVIGGSEVGSRDVILLAGTGSFISLTEPHHNPLLHTLVYHNCLLLF